MCIRDSFRSSSCRALPQPSPVSHERPRLESRGNSIPGLGASFSLKFLLCLKLRLLSLSAHDLKAVAIQFLAWEPVFSLKFLLCLSLSLLSLSVHDLKVVAIQFLAWEPFFPLMFLLRLRLSLFSLFTLHLKREPPSGLEPLTYALRMRCSTNWATVAKNSSRDDWIRTSDHTPPRRVFYRAELRPEFKVHECVLVEPAAKKGWGWDKGCVKGDARRQTRRYQTRDSFTHHLHHSPLTKSMIV